MFTGGEHRFKVGEYIFKGGEHKFTAHGQKICRINIKNRMKLWQISYYRNYLRK